MSRRSFRSRNWLGRRSGRGCWSRRNLDNRNLLGSRCFRDDFFLDRRIGGRRVVNALAFGLDHRERRADRHHVADFAREFDDDPRNRRFHLDGRLVGHHVGELLILLDRVADLDVPRDDLGLGNAFADIGQAEFEPGHRQTSFMIFLSAWPMRTGPGKYAHSRLCGYGVS